MYKQKYIKYKNKYFNLGGNEIKNAVILLIYNNSILFVRDIKTKEWMLIGGKLNNNEDSYEGAKREFDEETGFIIDEKMIFSNINYDIMDTRIYIIETKQHFNLDNFKATNETDLIYFIKIDDLIKFVNKEVCILKYSNIIIDKLKSYTKDTIIEIYKCTTLLK